MVKMGKITALLVAAVFCFISCQNQTTLDTTPPETVTELKAVAEAGKIVLTWTDPADEDLYAIKVYNGTVSAEARAAGLSDGILVNKGLQKYEISGLEEGKAYKFKVSAIDGTLNESDALETESVVFIKKYNEIIYETEVKKEVEKIIEKPIEKIVDKTVTKEVPRTFAAAVTYTLNDLGASGLEITMYTATEGAEIRYTLDGSEPGVNSVLYSTPIIITEDTTIKAVAVKSGIENSSVSAAEISILARAIVNAVTLTSEDLGPEGIRVSMSTSTPGATIYYTTNGLDPDFASTQYSQPLVFKDDATIKAIAIKDGMDNGPVSVGYVSIVNKVIKRVVYTAKLPEGTYTIHHNKQKTDGTFQYNWTEDSNVTVTDNTSISDLKKDLPGFYASFMSRDKNFNSQINIAYYRLSVEYTFNAGTEGKFDDGTSVNKVKGMYEAACSIPVPTSTTHQFIGWISETSGTPDKFGLSDMTFTAIWMANDLYNCEVGDIVLEGSTPNTIRVIHSSDYVSTDKDKVIAVIIRKKTANMLPLGVGIKLMLSSETKSKTNYLHDELKYLEDGSKAMEILKITNDNLDEWPNFKYCKNYGSTNNLPDIVKTGWYLPSKSELKLLYTNTSEIKETLEKLEITGFYNNETTKNFVSCNSYGNSTYYTVVDISSGSESFIWYSSQILVGAVRTFN